MRGEVCRHNNGGGAALAAAAAVAIILAETGVKPSGSTSHPAAAARPAPAPVHTVVRTVTRTVTMHAHLLSGTDIVLIVLVVAIAAVILGCARMARHLQP
jgi:hypothetical protein